MLHLVSYQIVGCWQCTQCQLQVDTAARVIQTMTHGIHSLTNPKLLTAAAVFVSQTAFLPPPGEMQQADSHHANVHTATTAPSSNGGGSSSKETELSTLDAFGHNFVQQSGLLKSRPPLKPGRSGSSNYTVAPYQVMLLGLHVRLVANGIMHNPAGQQSIQSRSACCVDM